MGLINGTVNLENNYLIWKNMFYKEKEILIDLFKDKALSIEHVGSTSVEDLLSKPIIDIVIGVKDINDINIKELENYYTVKYNKNDKEILLIKEDDKETFYLIHVLEIDSDRYKNMIYFRDILINNKNIKKEYEKLKKELASKYYNDRKTYTKLKNDFINEVLNNTNN